MFGFGRRYDVTDGEVDLEHYNLVCHYCYEEFDDEEKYKLHIDAHKRA